MLKVAGPLLQGNYKTMEKKTRFQMRTSQDDKHCLAAPSIFYLMFSEARKKNIFNVWLIWPFFSCVVDLQCTEAKSPSVVGTKTENHFEMEDLKSRTSEDLVPGILRRISRPYHRSLVTLLYLILFFCKYLSPFRNMINKKLEKIYDYLCCLTSCFKPVKCKVGVLYHY